MNIPIISARILSSAALDLALSSLGSKMPAREVQVLLRQLLEQLKVLQEPMDGKT